MSAIRHLHKVKPPEKRKAEQGDREIHLLSAK